MRVYYTVPRAEPSPTNRRLREIEEEHAAHERDEAVEVERTERLLGDHPAERLGGENVSDARNYEAVAKMESLAIPADKVARFAGEGKLARIKIEPSEASPK
jgi:hypothetical protein